MQSRETVEDDDRGYGAAILESWRLTQMLLGGDFLSFCSFCLFFFLSWVSHFESLIDLMEGNREVETEASNVAIDIIWRNECALSLNFRGK